MRSIKRNALTSLILSGLAIVPGYALAQDEAAAPATQDAPAAAPAPQDVATLETVVITGEIQYRNRTETTAPELVYDQEFFAQFEPVSVGDQLRRVPGIAFTSDIGESDSPQMRGLGQGYTQVLVNGRPLPGAGNDRTVFVDRIPAEIVDRIEIIRSPSADIDSQGVGGTINIILKDGASLPPGVIARVGATYNVEAGNTRGNVSGSWSGRNEAETVFYSLTVDAQERFNNKDVVEEVFEEDSVGFAEEVASGGSGRSLARFDDPEDSSAIERVEEQDSRDTRDLSFNGDMTWMISESSSLRLDGFALSTSRDEHQDTQIFEGDGSVGGLDLGDPELEFQDADFNQESTGFSALFEHDISDQAKFDLHAGYANFRDDSVEVSFEEAPDNMVSRETIDTEDTEWTYGASITQQLPSWADGMGIDNVELKYGIVGKTKDRKFDFIVEDDLDDDEDVTLLDSNFVYKERRLDAYARIKWQVNAMVTIETGLRAEDTKTEQDFSTDFFEAGELEDSQSGDADSKEFMLNPSLHVLWKVTAQDQFRFSAARTVRRPDIAQIVPAYVLESPGDEDVTIGNPNLNFESAIGFDVGWEHRFGKQGVMGINLFNRDISNLIGLVATGQPVSDIGLDDEDFPGGLYTFENLGDARTHGVEFDLSTPLDFMGLPDTGVFANYTRLWSERPDPATGEDISIDFQPTYVYNVGVQQDIAAWDASVGFSYQRQGESRFVTYGEIESQIYDGNLELFVEKRFGKRTVLRLTGNNLLNAASTQAEAGFDGDSGEELLANQAAYNVDAFEVEREKSSPKWTLTLRVVF